LFSGQSAYLIPGIFLLALLSMLALRKYRITLRERSRPHVGLVISSLSFLLYLYGTYHHAFPYHWLAALLFYSGLVGYLGGSTLLSLSLPLALLFGLLPFLSPSGTISSIDTEAGILALTVVFAFLNYRFRSSDRADCEFCAGYRTEHSLFCLYCGKNLRAYSLVIDTRAVASIFLVMILLLGVEQISVNAVQDINKTPLSRSYSLDKIGTHAPLIPAPGFSFNQHQVYQVNGSYIDSYNASNSLGVNQVAWLTFDTHKYFAVSNLEDYLGTKFVGFANLSQGTTVAILNWTWENMTYQGVLLTWPVYVRNGTSTITTANAACVLGETYKTYVEENGATVISFANANLGQQSRNTPWNFLLFIYMNYIQSNIGYVTGIVVAVAFGLVYLWVRSLDFPKKLVFDNSLGLNKLEFQIYSRLSSRLKRGSGKDLLNAYNSLTSVQGDWTHMHRLISKFSRLGLMDDLVEIRDGRPVLVWRFTFA
jgi:hypothetical protein